MSKLLILALVMTAAMSMEWEYQVPSYLKFKNTPQMNFMKCVQDLGNVYKDAEALAEQLKTDSKNVTADIQDVVVVLQGIQNALPDCGVNLNLAPITTQYFDGFTSSACLDDIKTLVTLANQTYQDAQAKKVTALISDVTALFNAAKSASQDCNLIEQSQLLMMSANATFDAAECMARATDAVTVLEKYFTEDPALRNDMNHVIDHAFQSLEEVLDIISDECGLPSYEDVIEHWTPDACLAFLQRTSKNVIEVANSVSGGNIDMNALMKISGLMGTLEQGKLECPFINQLMENFQNAQNTTAVSA